MYHTSRRSDRHHATFDKLERFENWLRSNGAKFDQLELRSYDEPTTRKSGGEEKKDTVLLEEDPEMRGVHAKSRIAPHTIVTQIPRQCLITVEMGQDTPIGRQILQSQLDLDAPKHIYLMIYLLWDRKVNARSSFFWPYYEILPRTLSNMPIFWSASELSELQGSHLLHQIADRNRAIEEDYRSICKIANLSQLCTLDEFKWARMCVCSRNFGLQMDGHRTSALVPYADMLNHFRPRETKWTFDEHLNAFTITSLQDIPAGAEVLDSYGQKCNHRFLLNYGFAVEDNRELDGFCPNEVPLELTVNVTDSQFLRKSEFWMRGEHNAQTVKRVRVCVSNNENTRLLFSLLRTLACDEHELNAISHPRYPQQEASSSSYHQFHHATTATYHRSCRDIRHPISLKNEKTAMRLLLKLIKAHQAQYPTTLQQDLVLLQDMDAYPQFSNKRHAKIQVRGEKEVLEHFLHWANMSLRFLELIEHEVSGVGSNDDPRRSFETMIRHMEQDPEETVHHTILRYCADVLGSLRREELKQRQRR